MEQATTSSKAHILSRWLVPLAALIVFGVWFYIAPPGLLGKADSVGYAVCHRIDERSFQILGRQLPLCARCTGEFYSAGLTLFFLSIVSPKKSGMPGWKLGAPLLLFLVAFGIDGSNSYLYLIKQSSAGAMANIPNLYIPNNVLRLFTGSGMGIALASILFPAFNNSAWKIYDPAPALHWKKLGAIIGIVLILDLLILTEHPAILYPIAIISVLGVLSLLIIVFSMVWVMIMRLENGFDTVSQMWMGYAIENNTKFAFNVEVRKGDSKYTIAPIMYRSEFNNSIVREPAILTLLTRDIYFSPLGYDEGGQTQSQHSHNHISLEKGASTVFEGTKITFIKFNMAAETMQLMSEGKDFQMGAVLEIEKDGKKIDTELLRKKVGEQIEFTSFISEEMNLKIELENLPAGVIDIAVTPLSDSTTENQTVQTTTNEVLSVTASIKPFVNLVWAGVAIMVIGFFIAMTRRLKESKIIS